MIRQKLQAPWGSLARGGDLMGGGLWLMPRCVARYSTLGIRGTYLRIPSSYGECENACRHLVDTCAMLLPASDTAFEHLACRWK